MKEPRSSDIHWEMGSKYTLAGCFLMMACGANLGDGPNAPDAGDAGTNACALQVPPDGDVTTPREIDFANPGTLGIFDPSTASAPSSSRVWMSYSTATPAADPSTSASIISNRIAYTDDGSAWHDSGVVFPGLETTFEGKPAVWQYETSGLVFDGADADPLARWKLFSFRYLVRGGKREFNHSWVAMSSAPDPSGPWSAETKIFTGFLYGSADDAIGGPPSTPWSALDPSLADCATFDEPSGIVKDGTLYLALTCETKTPDMSRVVLVRRSGGTWAFVATLLSHADASRFGFPKLTASSFFAASGKVYLIESPQEGGDYRGCLVFEVKDLATGTLDRCPDGPKVVGKVNPLTAPVAPQTLHRGACTYDAKLGATGWIYFDRFIVSAPGGRVARTYSSGLVLP